MQENHESDSCKGQDGMVGREEYGELLRMQSGVAAWACISANGTGPLLFTDDVTADK